MISADCGIGIRSNGCSDSVEVSSMVQDSTFDSINRLKIAYMCPITSKTVLMMYIRTQSMLFTKLKTWPRLVA